MHAAAGYAQWKGRSEMIVVANQQTQDALQEMALAHLAQYDAFPDVIVIDLITARRLKENQYDLCGPGIFSAAHVLDDKITPSSFIGIPVEVIE